MSLLLQTLGPSVAIIYRPRAAGQSNCHCLRLLLEAFPEWHAWQGQGTVASSAVPSQTKRYAGIYRDTTLILKNQMACKMEHETNTEIIVLHGDSGCSEAWWG